MIPQPESWQDGYFRAIAAYIVAYRWPITGIISPFSFSFFFNTSLPVWFYPVAVKLFQPWSVRLVRAGECSRWLPPVLFRSPSAYIPAGSQLLFPTVNKQPRISAQNVWASCQRRDGWGVLQLANGSSKWKFPLAAGQQVAGSRGGELPVAHLAEVGSVQWGSSFE